MSRKIASPSTHASIRDTSLEEALSTRYLSYALSTITARSLPDVRDGLKPVQRRILYAMKESGNTHDKNYKKSFLVISDLFLVRYYRAVISNLW